MSTPDPCDSRVQLLYEMTEIVREEIGLNEIFATQIAEAIMRGMCKRYGAQEVYIPAPDRRARDEAIRRSYNGRNLQEVMREHGVSRATVFRVCGK